MKKATLCMVVLTSLLYGEMSAQVGIGTTSPVTELEIYSPNESTTLTNFTQALANGGLLIQTDYTANAYTPGLFWSTSNDNNTKPKAGIFLQETGSGTYLVFGTSNAYATGITNTSFKIDPTGNATFGDGSFYGDSRLSLAGTRGNNDATLTTALEDGTTNPVFSILPWSSQVYLSSGVYYNNGSWTHQSDDGNNQLFVLDPGGGVRWFASNTGSGSWNVASNEQLWDDGGNWKNLVHSTHGGNSYFTGGNVGIGTSSPSETFHVAGTLRFSGNGESAGDVLISDATGVATWQPATTVQDGNGIYDGDGTAPADVDVTVTDDIDFDGGTFFIDGTNDRIGVGTAAPAARIHANGTDAEKFRLESPTAGTPANYISYHDTGGRTGWEGFGSGGNDDFYVYNETAGGAIRFATNSTDRMWISSAGLVGIGTTSPTEKLDVFPDTDNSSQIGRAHVGYVGWSDYAGFSHVDRNATGSYALLQHSGGSTYLNSASGTPIYFRVNNVSQMVMNTTGLGIGNTAPTAKLHVTGSVRFAGNGEGANKILVSDATGVATWQTPTATNTNSWQLTGNASTNPATNYLGTADAQDLVFRTNAAEEMRITSGGFVGIGTTSPLLQLKVVGDIEANNQIRATGWLTGTGTGHGMEIGVSGGIGYMLSYNRTSSSYQPMRISGTSIAMGSSGTYTDLVVSTSGNVGVGTATPTAELEVAGWIGRTAHNNGALVGSYNNIGANGAQSNPIYVIGSAYKPLTTTLSNMYGTGYAYNQQASFISGSGSGSWGQYVASDGDARIWFGAGAAGNSYFNTTGNIGIGTDSPNARVDIRQTTSPFNSVKTHLLTGYSGGTSNRSISIQQIGNATQANQFLMLNGGLGSTSVTNTPTFTSTFANAFGVGSFDDRLSLMTAAAGTNVAAIEGLSIDNTGEVGIGITAPETNLHIDDGMSEVGDEGLRISDNSAAGSFLKLKDFSNVASNFVPLIHGKGIGTGSERNGLVMYGEVGQDGGDDVGIVLDGRNASSALSTANVLEVRNYGTSYMAVAPNGDVGVGTVSPSARMHVAEPYVSALKTQFTTTHTYGGYQVETTFTDGTYTPGLFWNTSNNNQVRPKAGIYLFQDAANGTSMYFGTSNNYSAGITNDAMIINSTGQIGVLRSPETSLDVNAWGSAFRLRGGNPTTDYVDFTVQGSGGLRVDLTTSTGNGSIDFRTKSTTHGLIVRESDGTGASAYGNIFVTDVAGTDYMTLNVNNSTTTSALNITALNYVGIGTATPGGQFELSLNQGRKPGSNTWTIVSDERLKDITGSFNKGLAELEQLQPITYRYKNVGEREFAPEVLETEFVGFTAQNVKEVFPEAVGTDPDGYLNLDSHAILVAYLNAIKELNAKVTELTEKSEVQEKTIKELSNRLINK